MHAIRRLSLRRAVAGPDPALIVAARRARLCTALAWLLAVASPLLAGEREARLGFLGDTGTGDQDQKAVRDQLLAWSPPLVFLLGDNVYDEGRALHIRDRFDEIYAPVIERGTAFHAALGNHDVLHCRAVDYDPLPADANAYRWRDEGCDVEFHLGHRDFGYREGRRYYSVTSEDGPEPLVEVFVLDSNTLHIRESKLGAGRDDAAQVGWLDEALAGSRARWKVVALHHPLQSPRGRGAIPGIGGHDPEAGLEAQIGPLLRKHEVEVVFAGHNHFYARLFPRQGIRHFVSGGGGRWLYEMDKAPSLVAAGGKFHHFVLVRATASRFEYHAIDSAGRSRDAGFFAKGDVADTPLPAGSLPPVPVPTAAPPPP